MRDKYLDLLSEDENHNSSDESEHENSKHKGNSLLNSGEEKPLFLQNSLTKDPNFLPFSDGRNIESKKGCHESDNKTHSNNGVEVNFQKLLENEGELVQAERDSDNKAGQITNFDISNKMDCTTKKPGATQVGEKSTLPKKEDLHIDVDMFITPVKKDQTERIIITESKCSSIKGKPIFDATDYDRLALQKYNVYRGQN